MRKVRGQGSRLDPGNRSELFRKKKKKRTGTYLGRRYVCKKATFRHLPRLPGDLVTLYIPLQDRMMNNNE